MTNRRPNPWLNSGAGACWKASTVGHAVICDDKGQIVESWGNPAEVIFPRSSCKMIQALPLMESGAFDAAGLTEAHAAFACASHQGSALHVTMARTWLAGSGSGRA